MNQDLHALDSGKLAHNFAIGPGDGRENVQASRLSLWGQAIQGRFVRFPLGGASESRGRVGRKSWRSREKPIQDGAVGVDAAVAQEGPVAADFFHDGCVAFHHENLFFIVRGFGENAAERVADEGRAPEFEAAISGPSKPTRFTAAT